MLVWSIQGESLNLQSCNSVAVGIGGLIVRNSLDDRGCIHVYCKECFSECRIFVVNGVHVINRGDHGRDVNLVEIEAPDAVVIPLDAGERIDSKLG